MKHFLQTLRTVGFLAVFLTFSFLGPHLVLSATSSVGAPSAPESGGGGLTNPLNSINSLPDFLDAILGAVVQLGTIVLTLAIVYVGFLFVKAQGKEEELKNARSALMWTVIGGLVLLGAQTIGMVIGSTVDSLR
ncbi:MAG: hypothetical protein AAB737_02295 [Patescibacteria group bacterium]